MFVDILCGVAISLFCNLLNFIPWF
uniref:Uncharacterized protein n=1 Tax=Rhizophora mucronata TaxID=61149 RepID=A0A2P2NIT9_RHIMU